jgi:hypothetical protein
MELLTPDHTPKHCSNALLNGLVSLAVFMRLFAITGSYDKQLHRFIYSLIMLATGIEFSCLQHATIVF